MRYEELEKCFESVDENIKIIVTPLLRDMIFLENELSALRRLPQIRVHPNDPSKQEQTPASKLYATFIARYTEIINKLTGILRREDVEEISPLREYLKNIGNNND